MRPRTRLRLVVAAAAVALGVALFLAAPGDSLGIVAVLTILALAAVFLDHRLAIRETRR